MRWPLGKLRGAMIRIVLYPIWLARQAELEGQVGERVDPDELVARTDELNRAAERYFAEYPDREALLAKPFGDGRLLAKHLFNVGVLMHGLRLEPGDVVVELGAGSCWLSHFLNLNGCRTIAVDVSPTALEIGRELFRRHPHTRWELEPEFLAYDGHAIDLPDGSCDRIIVNDAFHHVPNQRQVLSEMLRILREDGIVAMCEPGAHHSGTGHSVREVRETGVLENDIVVEELAELAREVGFAKVTLIPLTLGDSIEIPAGDLRRFMKGRGLLEYWAELCNGLECGHYLLLYKGEYRPTTRRPDRLHARIEIVGGGRDLAVRRGQSLEFEVELTNRGNTRWLAAEGPGWTRLGVHLEAEDDAGSDFDWCRVALPGDVAPRESVRVRIETPAIERPGRYELALDLVVEGLTWFAERETRPARVRLTVTD